jgi:hypothetical protein
VVPGEREKEEREPVLGERERKGEGRGGGEWWSGGGLDGTHTLIEGPQLTTSIQSTKRRGAGQVDPLHASIAETEERKKRKNLLF